MKILVTGANGQLGCDVITELLQRGHAVMGTDLQAQFVRRADEVPQCAYLPLDLTAREETLQAILQLRPDAVIHCAAWTAVDAAEEEASAPKVYAVNVQATGNVAAACNAVGAKMMYLSTDYVFNGQGTEPWQPDQRDFQPLNYYGKTKLEGEEIVRNTLARHFIVRIAWVFGHNGKNFVDTMLSLGRKYDSVRVVNDQIGTPTYTRDLARLLADMIVSEAYGNYHATNEGGYISWYDFACKIFALAGYPPKVIPVTTAEYGLSKAKRPFNSRLDKRKLAENGFTPLPTWEDALRRYLQEMGYADHS